MRREVIENTVMLRAMLEDPEQGKCSEVMKNIVMPRHNNGRKGQDRTREMFWPILVANNVLLVFITGTW